MSLLAEGETVRAISFRLGLAHNTTRRFARVESPEELLVNNRTGYRMGRLDEFKPYLHQRWKEGCTDAEAPDVRPRRTRPAEKANSVEQLNLTVASSRNLGQNQDWVGADSGGQSARCEVHG